MTDVARLLLEGIDEDAVDFRPTYDGETEEPVVLPGAFPNLLANGSQGIAVGMATSIPPHNAAELCDAALHLIEQPEAPQSEDADEMRARARISRPAASSSTPRLDRRSLRDRPRLVPRARAGGRRRRAGRHLGDRRHRNSRSMVQKARLIEKIAELLIEKKLPLLDDIRDECAEDIRVVLEPRAARSIPTDDGIAVQAHRARKPLPLNMNVLSSGKVPNVLGLAECLREWLDHRRDVLVRRSRHRLGEIERRLEILGGYLIAYLNIDEVIRIIREEDEPKQALIRRSSSPTCRPKPSSTCGCALCASSRKSRSAPRTTTSATSEGQIEALLGSEKRAVEDDRRAGRRRSATSSARRRRSASAAPTFADAPEHDLADIDQAMIEREPVTVVVSEKGWLRAHEGPSRRICRR